MKKTTRTFRLIDRGLARVTEGQKSDLYHVRRIPSGFGGDAFEVRKVGSMESYHIDLSEPAGKCECWGHLRWGHRTVCRHVALCKTLAAKGLI